jgi:hypothetical protein
MQLVVARVATTGVVASKTSAQASLEVARQSAEDRAISSKTTAAAAVTERDSLALRLALAEAEIEKLRVATVSAEEVAERAKHAAAIAESVAREASHTATREKATLEAKVSELESDLRMATTDLATTSRQLSQNTNQLQVVTEEASRLQSSNTKLSQDLEGKSDGSSVLTHLSTCLLSRLDLKTLVAGSRVIRRGWWCNWRQPSKNEMLPSSKLSRRMVSSSACRSSSRNSRLSWSRFMHPENRTRPP